MIEKTDKLNRGKYIEFIKNLIINSEQHKRNNDSDAYVIALDSAWGTGKSYFIDLFMQNVNNEESLCVVKYNAWKNDYCDNAFNPLIYEILNADCLQFSVESDADKENLKIFFKNIADVGIFMGKQVITKAIKEKYDFDLEETLKNFNSKENLKNFMLRSIPNLNEMNSQRESFEQFKKFLNNSTSNIKENGKKLVVIIDELDRCKPTFAIQTLEIVKHLFDVENIVFLFAVDVKQLSYSISNIYGQGFDSIGYLCRFFDYISKMPIPDISSYIKNYINEIKLLDEVKFITNSSSKEATAKKEIADFIIDIYNEFDFSLRDLDTVLQSYKIMLSNFLVNYNLIGAHMIYIFYLSLKYKKPEMFSKIFIEKIVHKESDVNDFYRFVSISFSKNIWLNATINAFKENGVLSEKHFTIYNYRGVKDDSYNLIIKKVNSDNIRFEYAAYPQQFTTRSITSLGSLNNILFWPDIENWEEIKNFTFREYLHKQLEMYGFPPSEDKG